MSHYSTRTLLFLSLNQVTVTACYQRSPHPPTVPLQSTVHTASNQISKWKSDHAAFCLRSSNDFPFCPWPDDGSQNPFMICPSSPFLCCPLLLHSPLSVWPHSTICKCLLPPKGLHSRCSHHLACSPPQLPIWLIPSPSYSFCQMSTSNEAYPVLSPCFHHHHSQFFAMLFWFFFPKHSSELLTN